MTLRTNRIRLLSATAAVLALTAQAAFADETKEAWRLFVADHTLPIVRAIDFDSGRELGRYDLKGYAALTASASGKTVFATQSEADVVHIIRAGIELSDHGEHSDIKVADGHIAITDPRHSLVRVVDSEKLKEIRTIAVDGQPFSIIAVGGSGASH